MINELRSRWVAAEEPCGTWTIWTVDKEDISDGGDPLGKIVASDIDNEQTAAWIVLLWNTMGPAK